MAYQYNRGNETQRTFTYLKSQGDTAIKYVNIVITIFLLIVGCIAIGIGAWLAIWTYQIRDLEVITGSDIYVSAYTLLIIAGVLILIICLVGCCGANQERNGLMLGYLIVLIISLLFLLIVGILGFVFNQQFTTVISSNYTTAVTKYYGVNLNNDRNKEITNAIDRLQNTFQCCGVLGNLNSSNSWYIYRSQSAWHQLLYAGSNPPLVPSSCCKKQVGSETAFLNLEQCQGSKTFTSSTRGTAAPLNAPPLTLTNSYLYQDGCITTMTAQVKEFTLMLGGVGIALAIFLIISVVVGCLLVKAIEDGQYAYKQSKLAAESKVPNEAKSTRYSHRPGTVPGRPNVTAERSGDDNRKRAVEISPALTRSTGFHSDDEFEA